MKLFFTVMLALMTIGANAQNLEGTYTLDDNYQEMIDSYVDNLDLDLNMDLKVNGSLFFNGNQIVVIINVKTEAEGMKIDGDISFPGEYVREGNRLRCTFNKDNMSVALMHLESDDPQIKDVLSKDETGDVVYRVVEEQMEEAARPYAGTLYKVCEFCKSFEIKSQTDTSLTLLFDNGAEAVLNKKQ